MQTRVIQHYCEQQSLTTSEQHSATNSCSVISNLSIIIQRTATLSFNSPTAMRPIALVAASSPFRHSNTGGSLCPDVLRHTIAAGLWDRQIDGGKITGAFGLCWNWTTLHEFDSPGRTTRLKQYNIDAADRPSSSLYIERNIWLPAAMHRLARMADVF